MRCVGTNALIYVVDPSVKEAEKRQWAQELLLENDLAVSVQVLRESYWQFTRPSRAEVLTHSHALMFLESVRRIPVQDVTLEVFRSAVSISRGFGLSYRDGAILAAERACGCDTVYSEELSDHQDYDGVNVINPFREQGRPS